MIIISEIAGTLSVNTIPPANANFKPENICKDLQFFPINHVCMIMLEVASAPCSINMEIFVYCVKMHES